MNDVTPRELFDAATLAWLAMPGMHKYRTAWASGSADFTGESAVVMCAHDGYTRHASLADVEAAVMDALAERGVVGVWRYANMNAPGYIWWCEYMDGKQLRRASGPTRPAALLAACESLAKEAK